MNRLAGLVIVCALTSALCAPAQAKSVLLRHSYTAGQIDKFKMSMTTQITMPRFEQTQPRTASMKVSMILTQKVLGVLPDGSAKMRITCSDTKTDPPELAGSTPASVSMTVIVAPDGEVLSIEDVEHVAGMSGLNLSRLAGPLGCYGTFPECPVEIGEVWRSVIPLPFGSGDLRVDSELLAAAIPVGKEIASKIRQTYEGYIDLGEIVRRMVSTENITPDTDDMDAGLYTRGWMVLYFSPSKGKLIKANGSINIQMNVQMPASAVSTGTPQQLNMQVDCTLDIAKLQQR